MSKLDFIKRTITEGTIARDCELDYKETENYYRDISQALSIENFPLISVNTIEKKTYMLQAGDGQCYLVFDHYLLEYMHLLNQFAMAEEPSKQVESLFNKILSEECFTRHKKNAAVQFAARYMENISEVIREYMKSEKKKNLPDYLFVQQAFLIAHELFHFYIHKNPHYDEEGVLSKKRFLDRIYKYVLNGNPDTAEFIRKAIEKDRMAEECLCDSTAVIQAIDVGGKTGKMDVADSGVAAALALMNQFTISMIQDAVKHSGDMIYERIQNLFNFRIVHLKAFTNLYIGECCSKEAASLYQTKVEKIHKHWLERVNTPIMHVLVRNYVLLKELPVSIDGEKDRGLIDILRRIYNS